MGVIYFLRNSKQEIGGINICLRKSKKRGVNTFVYEIQQKSVRGANTFYTKFQKKARNEIVESFETPGYIYIERERDRETKQNKHS